MIRQQSAMDILQDNGDVVPRIAPEVLEEARRQRSHDASRRATHPPRLPQSGHTLWTEIVAATIEGDQVEVAIRVHGQVQRPEALATASGAVLQLKVPAKVVRRADDEAAIARVRARLMAEVSDERQDQT